MPIKGQAYSQSNPNSLWYPYVQMSQLELPGQVVSAEGCTFELDNGAQLIDAISSWWCVIHGYNHPEINEAAKEQIDTLSHIMMGGLSHPWSQELADRLVDLSPEGLNHVFFADSGSVGVEVALKMSLQYWHNLGNTSKRKFVCLRNGYHGDTFGAMSVGEPDDAMQIAFPELLMEPFFVKPPGFEETSLEDALSELRQIFRTHHQDLAAFICEPIMQGYGGFHVYDPHYLKVVRELCDEYEVLFIVDEVATGLGRTGRLFAVDHAGISPDIMILSKALTAGYLGMSATLASTKVFESFWGKDPSKAFMHGPTFMGNALACRIALKSLDLLERDLQWDDQGVRTLKSVMDMESYFQEELSDWTAQGVASIRILGATAVVEVDDVNRLEGFALWARERGVWLRPIGPFLYTMPAFNMSRHDLEQIIQTIKIWFEVELPKREA